MGDKRFIAEHKGGPLTKEQHKQLMKWACDCSINVLVLFGGQLDERLINALSTANEWIEGNATVAQAREASLKAIAVANESTTPQAIAVARSIGYAVATAYMPDHAISAASHALKAVRAVGKPMDPERRWQHQQLPEEIKELILSLRT